MTDSKRLAAHRARASAADAPETPNSAPDALGGEPQGNEPATNTIEKENEMADEAHTAALAAAREEGQKAGFTSANERMNAVFASEHYAGRETLAAKMLAKPGLEAKDIIDLLADAPKTAAPAAAEGNDAELREAAEKAGREQMKAAIEETGNSDIDTGSAPKADTKKAHGDAWAKAYTGEL